MTVPKSSEAGTSVDIVFDGPPSHEGGRFVEVESPPGTSIKFGEWIHREDGYWVLRIDNPDALRARRDFLEARVADLELMLRAAVAERAFIDRLTTGGWWMIFPRYTKARKATDPLKLVLEDDGTGLPALTPAARKALEEEDGG